MPETILDLATLTALQRLDIGRCLGLNDLQHLTALTALEELYLYHCNDLRLMPSNLSSLRSLKTLAIQMCEQLEGHIVLSDMPFLKDVFMAELPALNSIEMTNLTLQSAYVHMHPG